MRRGQRKYFFLCVGICIFCFLLFCGQAVYAAQSNGNQVKTDQNQVNESNFNISNNTSNPIINWEDVWNGIKKIVTCLLGAIGSLLAIYKFILEKDYDIDNENGIEVELINKKPLQDIGYTKFVCEKITKNNRTIEQIADPNPYYLDIVIKISIPDGRKTLNNIIIKKLLINMDGYKLVCVLKDNNIGRLKKCKFNKQKKACRLLIKWPTIKEKQDRKELNPIAIFRDPDHVVMKMNWYPNIILSPVAGFLFPKKSTIEFEKIEHKNGSPRIAIKSKGIY